MGWFIEMLMVLSYSKRTQWLIVFAFVGCGAILFFGEYWLANFEFHGPMKFANEAMRNVADLLYGWFALAWLVSLLGAAVGRYQKDKKRFHASFCKGPR